MPKCKFQIQLFKKYRLISIKKQLKRHFCLSIFFLHTILAIGFLGFCLNRKNEYLVHFSGESN